VPAPSDYDDGEIGGMIGRGNRSTRRKPAPVPLCPPQTPHAARTRTRAAAVGSQRLTASELLSCGPSFPCRTCSWFQCELAKVYVVVDMCIRSCEVPVERGSCVILGGWVGCIAGGGFSECEL
jgi:hypothetical protein